MTGGKLDDAAAAMMAYLLVTSGLFIAGSFAFFDTDSGASAWSMLVTGLIGVGAAVALWYAPRPLPRRFLGYATGVAVVVLFTAFTVSDGVVSRLLCIQAAMFLGMHIGAYWPERIGWIWASVLTVSTLVASTLSSFDVAFVVYALTALGIVAATETFGAFARRMRHSATHDPLTGLLNRQGLEDKVEKLLPVFAARGLPVSMAVLDLDHFKTINDKYGHLAGDVLLSRVATAWRSKLRRGDVLGRLGGDEFLLFMPGTREIEAAQLLHELHLSHPAEWSVGLVCMPTVRRWSELYRAADAELYRAKRARAPRSPS